MSTMASDPLAAPFPWFGRSKGYALSEDLLGVFDAN